MTLSAVTVTHNSEDVIEACVSSLRAVLPIDEVIVVDNCSRDATRERAARAGAMVIGNAENRGYGVACNQGAQAAGGSHLLFVNPDVEFTAVDREALVAALENRPVGLLGPQLSSGRHGVSGVYRHRHWTGDMLEHVAGPLVPRELPRLPRRAATAERCWLSGAVLLTARDEFLGLGGFDERFFLYYEDRDLSRRYGAAGLPIRLTDAVTVRHHLAKSAGGDGASLEVRSAWSYLSWLEYLAIWHGEATARRADRAARVLRRAVDGLLAVLERGGPLAGRAHAKRRQLRSVVELVSRQAVTGSALSQYCPQARRIAGS
jgi:GT2 family glycosyltransferase